MSSEIQMLNNLCCMLYQSHDGPSRLQAERGLAEFAASPQCLQKCILLMESGTVPYAQMVASSTLMKLLMSKTGVGVEHKKELGRFLLEFLDSRADALPPFVITSLCQLFARLTKISWLDYDRENHTFPLREALQNITKLAEEGAEHSLLAVQLLTLVVADVNTMAGLETVSKQRSISLSFRDVFLFHIFKITLSVLDKLFKNTVEPMEVYESKLKVAGAFLQLSLSCLNYDFVGGMNDETSDEVVSMQVPTVWRSVFTDVANLRMYFRLFERVTMSDACVVLRNIVQMASVRRTIFSNAERHEFLSELAKGVVGILRSPEKLTHQDTFHEFCRLIAKLKVNYQLCELMKVDEYPRLMALLGQFTIESLRALNCVPNSLFYLLAFWQRMASSLPYVREGTAHLLDVYCPRITVAFVENRMELAKAIARGDPRDDPLDDTGALLQSLEQFSIICRCDYKKTVDLLMTLFDHEFAIFESSQNAQPTAMNETVACLSWLVTLSGSAIQGRGAFNTADDVDLMDGDLLSRGLKLMAVSDSRLEAGFAGNAKLEAALLFMLDQIRRTHMSEHVRRVSQLYVNLGSNIGINDENDLLTVFVRKIITNLKYWSSEEKILEQSLDLLNEIAMGFSAGKKLVALPDIQLLLKNHKPEYFAFLSSNSVSTGMRARTSFYASLTRLLCLDLDYDDDESTFFTFLQPLSGILNDCSGAISEICGAFQINFANVDEERVKRAVMGLCRDMRGVTMSCSSKVMYKMLIDWLYPSFFTMLLHSVEIWSEFGEVITPILKLLSELCNNRQQRLHHDLSTCVGVVLFREVSKIICAYGKRILALPTVPADNAYKQFYKNFSACFSTIKAALNGSYVPYGIFRLYGDTCLDDLLNIYVEMFLFIPEEQFHSYTKLAQNFYSSLESITQDNISFLANIRPHVFATFLRYLQRGMMSIDNLVVTSSCATLDVLLTYIHRRLTHPPPEHETENCIIALKGEPALLSEMLTTIMNKIIFEEAKCQWSMSRPLLGLILIQEEVFQQWKMDLLSVQAEDKQGMINEVFDTLMETVDRSLTTRNKDTFTQNLTAFRKRITEILRGDAVPAIQPVASSSDMVMMS